MKPYSIWLRRGAGHLMFPVLTGFLLVTLLSQPGWRIELDWATRLSAGSLVVICPVVAAVAAFDTSRRLRPTLTMFGRASVRGHTQIALPAAAVVTWAVASYLATWTVAAVIVALHGGIGIYDWWVFPEIVAPLIGSGAVGLLAGMITGNRVAPLIAVMSVLAGLILASPWGRGPFEAVTTYGTLDGLERPPERAAAAVLGVLTLALGAFLGAVQFNRRHGLRLVMLGFSFILMITAAIVPAAWPWKADVYRFTTETYGCIGSNPAVCGPQSRLPLLGPVQSSLAEAYTKLAGTDFVKPSAFRITRLDHYADLDGAAPLDFDPVDVNDGRYSDSAVARALVRPHQCVELFSDSAMPLLQASDEINPWLRQVLVGNIPAHPVPATVSSAFKMIENCKPMTWNLH